MSDFLVPRCVILRRWSAGKTSLLYRVANGKFPEGPLPTIDEKFDCTVMVRGKETKLQLQDTMGQEAFRLITQSFYQGCEAIVVCYDVTDRDSFDKLPEWMAEIKKYCSKGKGPTQQTIPIVLVGNKCDLMGSKAIEFEDGEAYAKSQNIQFFETSARDNVNTEDPFQALVELIMDGPVSTMKKDPTELLNQSGVIQSKKGRHPCTIL